MERLERNFAEAAELNDWSDATKARIKELIGDIAGGIDIAPEDVETALELLERREAEAAKGARKFLISAATAFGRELLVKQIVG